MTAAAAPRARHRLGPLHSARVAVAIAGRELGAYVHSAIAYVVAIAFLAVQGLSFWAIVQVLSDPHRQAPYGAVLEAHFGGTVLSWAVLFALVAALSMRLIAEEKRQGTWEALLSAPVPEGAAVVGKWLGAVAFCALLWVPTLTYVGLLWAYLPEGGALDFGPVASAYGGVVLAQAGFLALGTAASAGTTSQVTAAVITFAGLFALLVVGQIPELAPRLVEDRPGLQATLGAIDVRAHLEGFAAGAVPLTGIVLFAGLAAAGLAWAAALAAAGRRRRAEVLRRALAAALAVAIAALAVALSARADKTYDATAAGAHSLEPEVRRALGGIERDVTAIVVAPRAEVFDPVYDRADAILDRMQRAQPRLSRRELRPARDPERARALAEEFGIAPGDLAEGGAVVFESEGRRRAVELLEMAEFGRDALGAGEIAELRAEEAFAAAIAEVGRRERTQICYTTERGEIPLASGAGGGGAELAAALERRGMALRDVGGVADGVPAACDALASLGPREPVSADAAGAIDRYIEGGGGLLLALRREVRSDGLAVAKTGLELPLARRGLGLPEAVALDPARALDGPGMWSAIESYGEHPITAGFEGRRVTVWRWPRVVEVEPPPGAEGGPLVSTTAAGYRTERLAIAGDDRPAREEGDAPGPVAVAAAVEDEASGGRVAVVGSAEALAAEVTGAGADGNRALAESAAAWLAGARAELEIGPKTPERVRLIMTEEERRAVFAISVLGLPLALAAVGGIALWWRRRGAAAEAAR